MDEYQNKNSDCKSNIGSKDRYDEETSKSIVPPDSTDRERRKTCDEEKENPIVFVDKEEQSETPEIIDIDEFLVRSNECGRYQILIVLKMMLMTFTLAYAPFIFYFVGFDPHWIHVGNSTTHLREDDSRCTMNRSEWRYDYDKSTIVTEYDLVCDRSWLVSLLGSVVFIGWALGSFVLGYLSDLYGRKSVMLPCLFIDLLCLLLHAFVTPLWALIALRFIMGFFHACPAINSYILIVELIGPNFRVLAVNIAGVTWGFSTAALALKAFLIDDWRLLCIAASAPYFLFIILGFWFPESVRWLNANGRESEAERILYHAAEVNKRTIENVKIKSKSQGDGEDRSRRTYSFLDLFNRLEVAKLTLCQGYIWMCLGMVYYTLSWAFADLGGDLYLNFILASIVELPMHAVCVVCLQSYGRKRTVWVSLALTVVSNIFIILIIVTEFNFEALKLVLGLMAKSTIALAFMGSYMWSSEMYPTVVRTQGLGFNIVTSRLGAAVSPFTNNLDLVHPALPFLVITLSTALAILLCTCLPETLGKPTRESFDDIHKD